MEKSGILAMELKESVTWAKKLAVEEFKFLLDFLGAVKDVASKYFGEGFDFSKWQLRRHHLDLTINLEGMDLYHDLLVEKDEDEEGEGVNEETGEKDKGDTNSPPS